MAEDDDERESGRKGSGGIEKYFIYLHATEQKDKVSIRSLEGEGGTFIEFTDSDGVVIRAKYEGSDVEKKVAGLVDMMKKRGYEFDES